MSRELWLAAAILLGATGLRATDQHYETYNAVDADFDGHNGGVTVQMTPFLPTSRADLPIDVDDTNSDFNPDMDDAFVAADDLDNDGDGAIDANVLSAPTLEIRDAAVEIPGDLIDNDGDFMVDEPPTPIGALVPENSVIEAVSGGADLVFSFYADNAYVVIQAYPTEITTTGGHQPSVPSTDPTFCQFVGNITFTPVDSGDWLLRVIAFNGLGFDIHQFTLRVLPAHQPDGLVGGTRAIIGDGIYDTFGGQTLKLKSQRASRVKGSLVIQNDGAMTDTIGAQGSKGDTNFRATYQSTTQGNVTAAIAAGTFTTASLDPDETETINWKVSPQKKQLKKVTTKNGKKKVKWKKASVSLNTVLTSQGDGTRQDRVRVKVKHK